MAAYSATAFKIDVLQASIVDGDAVRKGKRWTAFESSSTFKDTVKLVDPNT